MPLYSVLNGEGFDATVQRLQRQVVLYYATFSERQLELVNPWPGCTTLVGETMALEAWDGERWVALGGEGVDSGVQYLDDLDDVTIGPTLAPYHMLRWNGFGWVNTLVGIDDLWDVDLTSLANGQVLAWSDGRWRNAAALDEVYVGPSTPPATTAELWFDTDAGSGGGGAFAFKSALGSAVDTLSGNTLGIATTAAIAIGDVVVVRIAADNLSATTPTFACSDSAGNVYTTHHQLATQTTAAAGIAGGIMVAKATAAMAAGGSIIVTLSGAVAAKAAYAESFTGGSNVLTSAPVGSTATNGAMGPVVSGLVNSGDLVLGWSAYEMNATAITGDADTVNGSWSTIISLANAAGGTSSTRAQVGGQWKVANAAGAQTLGHSGATADVVGGVVVLASSGAAGGILRAKVAGAWTDIPTEGPPGATGATGAAGATGSAGPAGPGVPVGGTTGQVLTKTSATDFATNWQTPASGGGFTLVSALPGAPVDGQCIYYQNAAMAALGIIWPFRYRAAAAGSYKWEAVGATAWSAQLNGEVTAPVQNPYADFAGGTVGPSITVPLAGDYLISFACYVAPPVGSYGYASPRIGAVAALDADSLLVQAGDATGAAVSAATEVLKTAVPAAAVIKLQGRSAGTVAAFDSRRLTVQPIRVG